MKVHDNRHLDYSQQVEIGDLVLANDGRYYIFGYYDGEENTPYLQIDVDTFTVVDSYPANAFYDLRLGAELFIGGKIVEIIKNKNLVLDLRK